MREMGCAVGEILSSHVTKQCPRAILLGILWSPPLPDRAQYSSQILALPLIPSPGCPSGLGSTIKQLGVSERAKEAKRETFPQKHGGVIHKDTVLVHHQLSQVMPVSPTFCMGFYTFSPPPNRGLKSSQYKTK